MSYSLDNALFEWEEGNRRLQALADHPPMQRHILHAVQLVRDELRRRIGPTFSAEELADLYAGGTDWALQIAVQATPEGVVSNWDPQAIVDGAFFQYLRGAHDWAGGRRIAVE